jgi:AAA-like domain
MTERGMLEENIAIVLRLFSIGISMATTVHFHWTEALTLVDRLCFQATQKHLSDVEILVLQGAWEGKTYDAIASESYLTVKYVGEVGGRLWQLLSHTLEEEVKKTNFRQALLRRWHQDEPLEASTGLTHPTTPIALNSQLPDRWVPRAIESICYSEVTKPGALLRIKAPLQFGKTTLMSRILQTAATQGYRTVTLNLRDAVREDFETLTSFLQWFLTHIVSAQDDLSAESIVSVEEHWQRSLGNSKIKCRTFFEKYLLKSDQPLVIAIDEVDRLFQYSDIVGEFLGMLRTWHEDAKTKLLWGHLRLIVVYVEVYMEMNINQSPFNAGMEVQLTDFETDQIDALAQSYGFPWTDADRDAIQHSIGGHPYLVDRTLETLAHTQTKPAALLPSCLLPNSPYRSHLERQWHTLQNHPTLIPVFRSLLAETMEISLLPIDDLVKLYDLGLIQLRSGQALIRYPLYQHYFGERFGRGT